MELNVSRRILIDHSGLERIEKAIADKRKRFHAFGRPSWASHRCGNPITLRVSNKTVPLFEHCLKSPQQPANRTPCAGCGYVPTVSGFCFCFFGGFARRCAARKRASLICTTTVKMVRGYPYRVVEIGRVA